MKEAFIQKKFSADSLVLIHQCDGIIEEYTAQNLKLSLRQLYYQLVAKGVIPNNLRSYKNLGNLVSDARLAGMLDWDCIEDRGREVTQNTHWEGPSEILRAVAKQFRMDLWRTQDVHVEVMVEKAALEGVLIPLCRNYDICFTANKGYSSQSAMYEAAQRMRAMLDENKDVVVLYLGDHDPSGIDMTRDVRDRLQMLARSSRIDVRRLALNMDLVEELNPPPNPAKLDDSRAASYIAEFGESSWELDAVEPRRLISIVETAIKELRDPVRWQAAVAKQDGYRKDLNKVLLDFKAKESKDKDLEDDNGR